MGRDGVCKDEYSEDSDEFAKEMNPSETNLLKMKKKSSLTQAEKQNECWKIAMKRKSEKLNRI